MHPGGATPGINQERRREGVADAGGQRAQSLHKASIIQVIIELDVASLHAGKVIEALHAEYERVELIVAAELAESDRPVPGVSAQGRSRRCERADGIGKVLRGRS